MKNNSFKKVSRGLIAATIFTTLMITPGFAQTGEITGNGVRVRKEPSTSSTIVTLVEKGKKVEILDEKSDWYKISTGSSTGWVSAELIKKSGAGKTMYVNTEVANLRKSASTSSSIAGKLTKGAKVTTLEMSSDGKWYKIKHGNTTAWISAELLSSSASASTSSSTSTSSTTGTVNDNNVNLRASASTSAKSLAKLSKNKKVTILSTSGEWYKVSVDGKTGYIHTKCVDKGTSSTTTTTAASSSQGKINDNNVNLRKSASTSSKSLAKLSKNKVVTILSTTGEWYKVSVDGKTGYVHSKCLDKVTSTSRAKTNTSKSSQIVTFAKKYLGYKYVWGAAGPSSFDCSGFTQYVFKKNGITLPRTSAEQSKKGTKVVKSKLQAGDLVFFSGINGSGSGVSHVGIYIGNDKFIHAANSSRGVVIDELSSTYYSKHYVTAKRFI